MMPIQNMVSLVLVFALPGAFAPQPAQPPQMTVHEAPASPAAIKAEEAKALAQGWTLVVQGNAAQALAHAEKVLSRFPRSAGALALAIESAIGRSGALPALGEYERWLGARTLEEPVIVRRIGHALLKDEAAQHQDNAARMEALRALAAAGDADALAELQKVAYKGGGGEVRALAALGDERAVKILLADMEKASGSADLFRTLDALGKSGSNLALPAVTRALGDSRMEVRAAAAEALGRIAGSDAADRLDKMLSAPNEQLFVKIKAAAALLKMGDERGRPYLQQLAESSTPDAKLMAVEAMSDRPDANWIAQVRELAQSPDPTVRAGAARLIAPHDPEAARLVLEPLLADQNPAIRELAASARTEALAADLTGLRGMLKHNDRLMRIRAAARILALTK